MMAMGDELSTVDEGGRYGDRLKAGMTADPGVGSGAGRFPVVEAALARVDGLCEVCSTWCEIDLTHRLLTGHHADCPRSPKAIDAALELIAALARSMEMWGAEEDGIYEGAWESYCKAKALQGVFLPLVDDGQRSTSERMWTDEEAGGDNAQRLRESNDR
jgi:hypothetical protein